MSHYKVTVGGAEYTGIVGTIAAGSTGTVSLSLPGTSAESIADVAVVIYE